LKHLKLFESWVNTPTFYRLSHYDLLNGNSNGEYQPTKRVRMIGPSIINDALVNKGFPDKTNCVHFMDEKAFNESGVTMVNIWGRNSYEVKIDDNSIIAWTFLLNINDWYLKSSSYRYYSDEKIIKDLKISGYDEVETATDEYDDIDIESTKIEQIESMTDLLVSNEVIGFGKIDDLKKSKYYNQYRLFAWTNDKVYLNKIK